MKIAKPREEKDAFKENVIFKEHGVFEN